MLEMKKIIESHDVSNDDDVDVADKHSHRK